MFAAGGDRLEDLAQLRQDQGLAATAGFELATPDVALNFPYRFHDPKLVEARPQNTLAFVPSPSEPLQQVEIRFAVSAPMSAALKQASEQEPKDKWKRYVRPGGEVRACDADIERHWVDLNFVSMAGSTKRDGVSERYIGLRIRNRQGELFADGSTEKYFAVVTNDFDSDGGELLHWQRQKAGTIEQGVFARQRRYRPAWNAWLFQRIDCETGKPAPALLQGAGAAETATRYPAGTGANPGKPAFAEYLEAKSRRARQNQHG